MTREFKKCGNINIPLNWEYRPIKTIIRGISDGTHGTFERVGDGYPLLSAKNVFDDGIHIGDNESQISEEAFNEITANGYPHKDDILLCCVGTIGRSTIYPYEKPMAFQRSVIFLTLNQYLMLPEMMHYLLMSDDVKTQENNLINQSAQAGLYQGSVKQIRVVVPPLTEQKEIIRFLNSSCHRIDNAISRHQQIIEKLEEYRRSVITETIRTYTESLDPIRVKYLGGVQTGPFGTQLSASEYVKSGVPCINVKNIRSGFLSEDDVDYVPQAVLDRLPVHILHTGDIVFARKGSIDRHALVTPKEDGWMQGSDCIRFRPVSDLILSEYLNYYFETPELKASLTRLANGSTLASLNGDMIRSLPVRVPSLKEQTMIIQSLDNMIRTVNHAIDVHLNLILKLREYKQSLIYNAVTGKIDCRTEGGEVQ